MTGVSSTRRDACLALHGVPDVRPAGRHGGDFCSVKMSCAQRRPISRHCCPQQYTVTSQSTSPQLLLLLMLLS